MIFFPLFFFSILQLLVFSSILIQFMEPFRNSAHRPLVRIWLDLGQGEYFYPSFSCISKIKVWHFHFRQYLWVDEKGKKSRLSAPQYIDYIMTYVQKTINDEATFPTKHGNDFPTGFDTQIRKIFRLLFHVLAHIYHCHFKEIVLLQLHAHLNAVFVHFVVFSLKFQIVEEKELEVRFLYLKQFSVLVQKFCMPCHK